MYFLLVRMEAPYITSSNYVMSEGYITDLHHQRGSLKKSLKQTMHEEEITQLFHCTDQFRRRNNIQMATIYTAMPVSMLPTNSCGNLFPHRSMQKTQPFTASV